jgi:hypothetical protein
MKAYKFALPALALLGMMSAANAASCRDANGQWLWFNRVTVHLTADGHASTSKGGFGSSVCSRGVVVIRWAGARHFVDKLTLSPNGRSMTGFNQFNVAVSARKFGR